MESLWTGVISALWLGVLASISPCPLATNIVAISFVANRVGHPSQVVLAGTFYTMGRMAAYSLLGTALVASVLSVPDLAQFLQTHMNRLLGPVLIVSGILLLEIVKLRLPGVGGLSARVQRRAERGGIGGAALLGFVLALSFCPLSAAFFFGSLIPLALKHGSKVLMPSVFGLGTAVPVIGVVVLIALGAKAAGSAYERLTRYELLARRATALVFLAAGVYYSLIYNLGITA